MAPSVAGATRRLRAAAARAIARKMGTILLVISTFAEQMGACRHRTTDRSVAQLRELVPETKPRSGVGFAKQRTLPSEARHLVLGTFLKVPT